jgi:ATP-dependent Lon protease
MAEELLPLFPLQVVLFPHTILPLHIFEERYKQLISECVREGKSFGINYIQDTEVAKTGCTAVITQVLKKYDDGRLDILVQGERRYALRRLMAQQAPYIIGSVEYALESPEVVDEALTAEVVRLHNQLVALVYRDTVFSIKPDNKSSHLSYKLVQKAGMELKQRQSLLELDSENERLHMLREYFLMVIPKLKHLGEVERVIKSDGYIVN